jgi:hypothetical protein
MLKLQKRKQKRNKIETISKTYNKWQWEIIRETEKTRILKKYRKQKQKVKNNTKTKTRGKNPIFFFEKKEIKKPQKTSIKKTNKKTGRNGK